MELFTKTENDFPVDASDLEFRIIICPDGIRYNNKGDKSSKVEAHLKHLRRIFL